MHHADNDFGYEPTGEDIAAYREHLQAARVTAFDHDYKPGAYGVCRRCGEEEHGPAGSNSIKPARRDFEPDPFVSLTKEGEFGAPVYVFTRKSGQRLELNSKQYAELVNSQK